MLPDIRPGNTKILYFFNCLLDGMHTTIPYICDFSRGGLNVRLTAHIQTAATKVINRECRRAFVRLVYLK